MTDCKVDKGTYVSLRIKSFADANRLASAISEEISEDDLPFAGMAWLMEYEGNPWFAIRIPSVTNLDTQLDAIERAVTTSGVEVFERLDCRLDQLGGNATIFGTRWAFSDRVFDAQGESNV